MRSKMQSFILGFILIFIFSLAFLPAQAATLTVTDCASSNGNANRLEETIAAASSGDTIEFSCGPATINVPQVMTINKNLTIDGGDTIILDGADLRSIFSISSGNTVYLRNIDLHNAYNNNGGAIANYGTLDLNDVTIDSSRALFVGGAIYNAGTLTITDSQISNNSANNGGGITNAISSSVTITNSVLSGNHAGVRGGAISSNGTLLSLINSTVRDNTAGTEAAGVRYDSAFSSQNSHYENNDCVSLGGSLNNLGGNTTTNAIGCPGPVYTNLVVTSGFCNTTTNSLEFTIVGGDGTTFDVTGTGPGVPSTLGVGLHTLPAQTTGPNTWNLTIAETTGDFQTRNVTRTCNAGLSASATCIGADLQVQISAGDPLFDIMDGSTVLRADNSTGTFLITGPITTTNLRVVEKGGNLQSLNLTNLSCVASPTLSASAVCNGPDLQVTVSNGDAPFTIEVTDSVGVMSLTGQPLGVYTFTGPDTFNNITVSEESGDAEKVTLPSVTCTLTTPPITPVVPETVSIPLLPDPNALGCELTDSIDLANAPDNTYCRVLMRNGGVVGYSGAVPAQLVNLGVILAVDVYRLEGGMSVNTFPNYARVCLAGQGRLFYMDSRQAPRGIIELATEIEGSLTCGWIPAPGTLILTN